MIKKEKITNCKPYIESLKENVILTSVAQDTGNKHLYTDRNLISLFHLELFSLCLKKIDHDAQKNINTGERWKTIITY